ncbi:MAG: hypothetical protein ACKVOK_12840 [Flavobacteriales bacterium]
MRIALATILILLSICSFSQDREREIQTRIGYGITAYRTDVKYTYSNDSTLVEETDTDSAVASVIPIEFRYELHPRFNLGLDMRFGKYLYDKNDDNTGKSNRFSSFGLGLEGVIVSKPAFRWYGGLTFSGINLEIEDRVESGNVFYAEKFIWKGSGTRFYSGITWFILDGPVGLNFLFGYDTRSMNLKEYTRDGSSQDLTDVSGKLKVNGPEFIGGIVLRLKR